MIFYFSATGNCRYVAERAAAATGERCVSITACMQAGELAFTPRDGEMVGIVSPVYFWGLPSIVNAFLERLILGRPEYLWFAATYGTTTGQAGRFVSEHLRTKGLRLDARFSVRMPDSWTPMFDLSDKAKVQRTNLAAEPQIDALIAHIRRRDRGDFMRAKVPLPAVRVYYPHYERVRRTGYFAVTDACVGCGLCARNCPVSAIEIRDGRPVWVKEQCVMCLACLHRCPKFAIRRGRKTAGHGQYVHPEFAGKKGGLFAFGDILFAAAAKSMLCDDRGASRTPPPTEVYEGAGFGLPCPNEEVSLL